MYPPPSFCPPSPRNTHNAQTKIDHPCALAALQEHSPPWVLFAVQRSPLPLECCLQYLQYKNARPDYLKEIWKIINWKDVAQRFDAAKK